MRGEPQEVQCRVLFCSLDTPATKKLINASSYAHKTHPCHYCKLDKAGINDPLAYRVDGLPACGDQPDVLAAIFAHKGRNDAYLQGSVARYGFRYSEIMRLVGFNTAATSPLDPMHNSFLGLTMAFVNWLFECDLLPGTQADRFRATFETASYPGHLGRIPARVGKQLRMKGKKRKRAEESEATEKKVGTGLKADHWKRILHMLPIALYNAWRDPETHGVIDITDEERSFAEDTARQRLAARNAGLHARPENTPGLRQAAGVPFSNVPTTGPTVPPTISSTAGTEQPTLATSEEAGEESQPNPNVVRDRRQWYDAALSLTAALRILHAHHISYAEARDAVRILAQTARNLIGMGAHLTINWHASMHYAQSLSYLQNSWTAQLTHRLVHGFVALYGPLSGFGTWALERNNGILASVNHKHNPAEVPTTLMRHWVAESRLTAILNNPALDASRIEKESLQDYLRKDKRVRGSLMQEEARHAGEQMKLCRPIAKTVPIDLAKLKIYNAVLDYVQEHHPQFGLQDWHTRMYEDVPLLRQT